MVRFPLQRIDGGRWHLYRVEGSNDPVFVADLGRISEERALVLRDLISAAWSAGWVAGATAAREQGKEDR